MLSNYTFDYILVGLVLIISFVGIGQIIKHRKGLDKYKYGIFFILGGLLITLISTIGNSFFENHWENEYIMAFLLLKKVSSDWFFRHLCSLGYIFLLFGISMVFAVASKRRIKN